MAIEKSVGRLPGVEKFTVTEREMMDWVLQGKTDLEIGAITQRSPRTVRFHVENAKKKIGVATRLQAAVAYDRYMHGNSQNVSYVPDNQYLEQVRVPVSKRVAAE